MKTLWNWTVLFVLTVVMIASELVFFAVGDYLGVYEELPILFLVADLLILIPLRKTPLIITLWLLKNAIEGVIFYFGIIDLASLRNMTPEKNLVTAFVAVIATYAKVASVWGVSEGNAIIFGKGAKNAKNKK